MYDMQGVFYYLMRNSLEINSVSGTAVLLQHCATSPGVSGGDCMLTGKT